MLSRFVSPSVRLFSTSATPKTLPLIVQKYGGTSLGTSAKLEQVLGCVQKYHGENRVFAVVSALSSVNKEEGTTTRLLKAAELATQRSTTYIYYHIHNMLFKDADDFVDFSTPF